MQHELNTHIPRLPNLEAVIKSTRFTLTSSKLSVIIALYFLLMLNQSFFSALWYSHNATGIDQLAFMAASAVFAFCLIFLSINLLAFPYIFKAWGIVLIITGAMASYFMDQYHVIIDHNMVDNLMQTDIKESKELLNSGLVVHTLLFGLMPALWLANTTISYYSFGKEFLFKCLAFALSVLVIGVVVLVFYQDYASVFRNNRHLRFLISPSGYTYSLSSYAIRQWDSDSIDFKTLGLDAHSRKPATAIPQRKNVLLLVVGETARAENFSLNGYSRITNPNLSKESIVYFNNVHSCGTSTAVSVPCMFSRLNRKDFSSSEAKRSENLLDVLNHAGIDVLWRDNNSGCKGVCDRVASEDVSHLDIPELCSNDECFDMVLLHALQDHIQQSERDTVIVLHQKGSHGPAYFLRSPEAFQQFTPLCHSNELQQCSQTEIINAYDNTLLYTDYVLSQLIGLLKAGADNYNGALLYLSDHGESLSENNLYLHGLPYSIAPEQQTHVPMFFWLSDGFSHNLKIDQPCLKAQSNLPFSHDNLFDTVLDLMQIDTSSYQKQQSIIRPCMG